MTSKLPPVLLSLFTPRPPLEYKNPLDKPVGKRAGARITGIASFVPELQNYDPDYVPWKSVQEKRQEKIKEKRRLAEEQLIQGIKEYNRNKEATMPEGDPFKTLFVAHLSYSLTEADLEKEFEEYGTVKSVKLVRTPEGKSRGYAFIEFEKERHMRGAYKDAEGVKLDGRRIITDVERGHIEGWLPRRLGKGLGGRTPVKPKDSGGRPHDRERRDNYGGDRRRGYEDRRSFSNRSRSRSPRGYRPNDRHSSRGRDRYDDRSSFRGDRRDNRSGGRQGFTGGNKDFGFGGRSGGGDRY